MEKNVGTELSDVSLRFKVLTENLLFALRYNQRVVEAVIGKN